MKNDFLKAAIVALLFFTIAAVPQFLTVMVDGSGRLQRPINFVSTNGLLTRTNVAAGSNVVFYTNSGKLYIASTASGGGGSPIDTNAFQPASLVLSNLAATGAITNAAWSNLYQIGSTILSNIAGTGALTNGSAYQASSMVLSNLVGTGALTNGSAFQPSSETLTNLAGTGAVTNQGSVVYQSGLGTNMTLLWEELDLRRNPLGGTIQFWDTNSGTALLDMNALGIAINAPLTFPFHLGGEYGKVAGYTAFAGELGYANASMVEVDQLVGVTGGVQTNLDARVLTNDSRNLTFTGTSNYFGGGTNYFGGTNRFKHTYQEVSMSSVGALPSGSSGMAQWRSTTLYLRRLRGAASDNLQASWVIPSSWATNTEVVLELRYAQNGTNPSNIIWRVDWMWQNVGETNAVTTLNLTNAPSADSFAWGHAVTELVRTNWVGKQVGSVFYAYISRNGTADPNNDDTFIHTINLLIKTDSLGSEGEYTKP